MATISVTPTSIQTDVDSTLHLTGSGWTGIPYVAVTIGRVVGMWTPTVDAAGNIDFTFTVRPDPAYGVGSSEVRAGYGGVEATFIIQVTSAPPPPPPPPPPVPMITVQPLTVMRGDTIRITGSGFTSTGAVNVFLSRGGYQKRESTTASVDGSIDYTMTVPSNVTIGTYTVRAYDITTRTDSNTVNVEVTELPPPPPPPTGRNGYVILTLTNKNTGESQTTVVAGCPPLTACIGPITVHEGDVLRAVGYAYKCDGSRWLHVDLGDHTVYVKSGACGDPGEDRTYGSGTLGGLPPGDPNAGAAWFQTEFAASADMIALIQSQTAKGYRTSLYANLTVDGIGWFSGEVSITTPAAPPPPPPPPPELTCETMFPNRWNPLHIDAYGYIFCILSKPFHDLFKWAIDNTAWIWQPIVTAMGNVRIIMPDWLTDFKTWLVNLPDAIMEAKEWLTNPAKKLAETATAIIAEESPSAFVTIANLLKTGYVQVPPKTPDWKLAPITVWVEATVHEWVSKWRKRILELAELYADDPATFSLKLTDEILYLETDAIATGMELEMGGLGLLEGGVRVVDVVLNYIAGGPITHIFDKTAIDESIAIASQQYWADHFRKHLPDPQEVINQVVKEVIPVVEFKRIMGLLGYSDEQAQRIWDAHFIAPARDELITALRRKKISPTAWNRLKILVDLDPRYDKINAETGEAGEGEFSIWNEMTYIDPGLIDIRYMFENGAIEEANIAPLLEARGYRPEHAGWVKDYITLFQSRFFRRRNLTLNARLMKAGKITEEEFYTRAKEAKYTHATAEWELKNQTLAAELGGDVTERTATLGTLNTWYLEDIIDADIYRDALTDLVYSETYIDRQLAYLDKKKAGPAEPGERQATLSMWGTWYIDDIVDAIQYREALTALGYDELTITRQLAELDLRKAPPPPVEARDAALANLNSWYMEDIIDATQYRSAAEQLRYTSNFIDSQLAYLDKKKAPAPPPPEKIAEATRAMYDTFYMEDIIDSAAWRAFYVTQKYPVDVIDLQLAYLDKKKTPPIDEDGPLPEERDLLQSEAISAFKKHVIDELTLRDRLDKLGRSDDAINVLVAVAKADMAVEQRDATLAVYSKAYRQGAILRSDYLAKLLDNNYAPDAAELIVQTEELSWGTGVEALTAEQTLNAWEQGFLTIEQTTDRLRKAGWTDADMKIRLSFSVIDMLKVKHLTTAEADKLWTDFGLGPEERARLASWYGWTPA